METLLARYTIALPILRLTEMSVVKIAISLWKNTDIKAKIKQFLQDNRYLSYTLLEEQKEIFRRVFEKVDQLVDLTPAQKSALKFVTMQVGISTFQWLTLTADYTKEDFVDHLRWNQLGYIDASETYRSLYFGGKIKRDTPLRLRAILAYCLEDCVADYFGKIPFQHRIHALDEFFPISIGTASIYWERYVIGLSPGIPIQVSSECEHQVLCILRGIEGGPYQKFRYFLDRATNLQKYLISQRLEGFAYTDIRFNGLAANIDGLNHIMKFMIQAGRRNFCERSSLIHAKIVADVGLLWPHQDEFFVKFVPLLQSVPPTMYYHMLSRINEQSFMEYQIIGRTQKYHNIIQTLWRAAPTSLKLAVSSNPGFVKSVIDILKVHDVELFEEIVKDESLSTVRHILLNPADGHWYEVLCDVLLTNCQTLRNFMQRIFHSDEERRSFKNGFPLCEMARRLYHDQKLWQNFLIWYFNSPRVMHETTHSAERTNYVQNLRQFLSR